MWHWNYDSNSEDESNSARIIRKYLLTIHNTIPKATEKEWTHAGPNI
jgi:hypothetical protein